MLLLMNWGWCKSENCDVNHCKSLFSTVFKNFFKRGTQHLCGSLDDTVECVDECLQTFFPDFELINSKTSVAREVCSYEIGYDLNRHWKCISGHFHRLLTCMSISGSMTPVKITSQTLKKLSCKKLLYVLDCPDKVLHDCEDEAIEAVNKLFSKVFKDSMVSACYHITQKDAYDLPVTYSLNNSYLETATCLDSLPHVTGNCFSQYLQNFDVKERYHCSNTCERLDGETCLPPSLLSGFYFPVLSFGTHPSCEEDSAVEDKIQIHEPSESSSSTYNSDVTSEIPFKDVASTTYPTDKNDDLVSSEETKRSDVLSTSYANIVTSTSNYRPNDRDIELDEVLSDVPSSSNTFPLHTSMDSSKDRPDIDRVSSSYAAENATENNLAFAAVRAYLYYLVVCFFAVLVFNQMHV